MTCSRACHTKALIQIWALPIGACAASFFPDSDRKPQPPSPPFVQRSPFQSLNTEVFPHPSHPPPTSDWSSPSPECHPHGEPIAPPLVIVTKPPPATSVVPLGIGTLPMSPRCLCAHLLAQGHRRNTVAVVAPNVAATSHGSAIATSRRRPRRRPP